MTANGGNNVLAMYTIEGTYGGGATQTVFGRTRYRIRGGLVPGAHYKVTNPYGIDTSRPATTLGLRHRRRRRRVAGTSAACSRARSARSSSGTRTGPPAGYLGDPTVPHTVTGSPFETNYVKIEGPNVGGRATRTRARA